MKSPLNKAAEADARYRLGDSLVDFFSKADRDALKSSSHLDLLPFFERYAEHVFNARAKEYLPWSSDPKGTLRPSRG